jgi:hypothetical protein
VIQPDRGGQALAVLGEALGSGREALLEQGNELGTDEKRAWRRSSRAWARKHAATHSSEAAAWKEPRCPDTADSATQKPAINPRSRAFSLSLSAGHAALSGAKSRAASSHCSVSASITKVSYLVNMKSFPLACGDLLARFEAAAPAFRAITTGPRRPAVLTVSADGPLINVPRGAYGVKLWRVRR